MKYKIKIIDENEQKEINIGEDEIIQICMNRIKKILLI